MAGLARRKPARRIARPARRTGTWRPYLVLLLRRPSRQARISDRAVDQAEFAAAVAVGARRGTRGFRHRGPGGIERRSLGLDDERTRHPRDDSQDRAPERAVLDGRARPRSRLERTSRHPWLQNRDRLAERRRLPFGQAPL